MTKSTAVAERPRIALELAPLIVPIDSVTASPRNPREGDVGAIVESLRRFGQQKPVVVQASTGHVVAGNHLLRAALALEWTEIAANRVDLSDREAAAFMLADNRTSDLGSYAMATLGEILSEIAVDGDLAGTGYDGQDVDQILGDLAHEEKRGPLGAQTLVSPIYSYTIIFDGPEQLDQWNGFLRDLRARWPESVTIASRLETYLAEAPKP